MDSDRSKNPTIFECRQCGECCKGFGGTYVTREDIQAISRHIDTDPDTFVRDYCDMAGSRPVLTQGPDGYCIFFDSRRQCTIHPVKPLMCRTWPYLPTIIRHPENWTAMASACPGMRPDVPVETLVRVITREQEKLAKDI